MKIKELKRRGSGLGQTGKKICKGRGMYTSTEIERVKKDKNRDWQKWTREKRVDCSYVQWSRYDTSWPRTKSEEKKNIRCPARPLPLCFRWGWKHGVIIPHMLQISTRYLLLRIVPYQTPASLSPPSLEDPVVLADCVDGEECWQ